MPPWALVTGGVGALGAAIVARLDELDTLTVVLDRQVPSGRNSRVLYHQVDVSDYRATQSISSELMERLGPPLYIVAATGLYERRSLFEYDPEALERTLRANLVSLVYPLRFFLQSMMAASAGRVIAISSQVGISGGSDPLYAAAKAGVTAIMKSVAKEYARSGVTFATVSPGPIKGTPMAQGMPEARRRYYNEAIPTGRLVTVNEVVDFVMWLLLEGSPACNGSTFDLDGGLIRR